MSSKNLGLSTLIELSTFVASTGFIQSSICTPLQGDKILIGTQIMVDILPTVSCIYQPVNCATDCSLIVWNHKDFQDRTVWLWKELAKHYKNNNWIAGYNPLNEPTDSKHTRLIAFYDRIFDAIRAIDTDHAIFFDGNTFASDFSKFGDAHKKWQNAGYSIHDYSSFGFPAAPEEYVSSEVQRRRLMRSYEKKRAWMDERGLCVWNGEWGPVYARNQYDGENTDKINTARYLVLRDQLEIYREVSMTISIVIMLFLIDSVPRPG